MAEYGEWNRKGRSISDVTAQKEYGVTHDFIVEGIRAGKLEVREGAVWGNPYLRVLRSQLEIYIAEKLGSEHLMSMKARTELRAIKKEIAKRRNWPFLRHDRSSLSMQSRPNCIRNNLHRFLGQLGFGGGRRDIRPITAIATRWRRS